MSIFLACFVVFPPLTVGSYFQPSPVVKHPSASPSTMPFLAGSVIFPPLTIGSYFQPLPDDKPMSGRISNDSPVTSRRLAYRLYRVQRAATPLYMHLELFPMWQEETSFRPRSVLGIFLRIWVFLHKVPIGTCSKHFVAPSQKNSDFFTKGIIYY